MNVASTPTGILRQRIIEALLLAAMAIAAAIGAWLGVPTPPPGPPVQPPPTEPPTPPSPPEPAPDPLASIMRTSSGNVGCSATLIGPKRPDGRLWVLTAAHCVNGNNQRWTGRLRDGRTIGFVIVNFNRQSDYAWGVTDSSNVDYPFALAATQTPPVGTKLWHAGFGVDVPGNREDGTLLAGPDGNGQIRFRMSVSSGDSGGGVVIDQDGKIVSTVCCTTRRGAIADVWGASPEAFRQGQRDTVDLWDWNPLEIPIREPVDKKPDQP